MRIEIEESESKSHEKLREKLLRQREALKSYMNVISKLRKEVELLTLKKRSTHNGDTSLDENGYRLLTLLATVYTKIEIIRRCIG